MTQTQAHNKHKRKYKTSKRKIVMENTFKEKEKQVPNEEGGTLLSSLTSNSIHRLPIKYG